MNKYHEYTELKNRWIDEHPDATPQEIEAFCKRLADELNI